MLTATLRLAAVMSWKRTRRLRESFFKLSFSEMATSSKSAFIISAIVVAGCHSTLVSSGLEPVSATELSAKSTFAWTADSAGSVRVYREPQINWVTAVEVSRSRAYVDSVLQITADYRVITVFVVNSQQRMNALLGQKVDGRSFYQTGVAAIVANNNWEANLSHELTHVALGMSWGKASSEWISEGIATWVGNPFYGRDIRLLARDRLLRTGKMIALETLNEEFDAESDEVTYLQSASIVQFIARRYGLGLLRDIWQNGIQAIPKATGLTIDAFDREWRTYLSGNEFGMR